MNCIKNLKVLFATFLLLEHMAAFGQEIISHAGNQLFDDGWKFALGDKENAHVKTFNDKQWRSLDLPHDWSIEGKIDPKNPMGNDGGYFPAGLGWYRKTFKIPSGFQGKRLVIYFEGVYMNAEVFINGKSLGVRPYGYSSFYHDLTPCLQYNTENVIAVKVDNSQQKNCRWYSGSGIYRHVRLLVTEPVHIDPWGIAITTPYVNAEKANVQIKTVIKNEKSKPVKIELSTILRASGAASAGTNQTTVPLAPHEAKEVVQIITVEKPRLWTPETPELYKAHIKLSQAGRVFEKRNASFGIRSLAFSTQSGFQLNGKKVVLNGGCLHHDNGCLGAAAYDRAEIRKVELLKAAGFNAVRTSHNPPSEAFLNACDSLGILVIDEAFDGWRDSKTPHDYAKYFDAWAKKDIETMVLRDRNHPSIIMWSTGNEIIERKRPEAVNTAKMLAGYVRNLDATRPVTSAMTTWDKDWEVFDPLFAAHDIGGYNYQLHRAAADHQRVPSRIIVQTESYPRDAFANWKLVTENNYILGDFVWTAMDYLGESSIGRYFYPGEPEGQHWEKNFFPWHGAYCGDIDLTGWRKPISHYRDLLYNDKNKLYMAVREPNPAEGKIKETMWAVWPTWESWTWPGYEEKDILVDVYSKYPKVRLYLNSKLVGEQATGRAEEFKAVFTVPYSKGELKAVGIDGDKERESVILKTAGNAAQIKLTADRKQLSANNQDLSFIEIEVTDKDGVLQPNAENLLSFSVNGPATIIGVANANLKDPDPYVSTSRKAWKGRVLLVLKTTNKGGIVNLEVTSPGLQRATINIESKKIGL